MLRTLPLFLAVAVSTFLGSLEALPGAQKEVDPEQTLPRGGNELVALDRQWRERGKAYLAAVEKVKSREQQVELAKRHLPAFDTTFIERFFELEERYRGKDTGLFSLWYVMMRAGGMGDPTSALSQGRERALGVLQKHYLHHRDLDFLLESLRGGALVMGSEPLLEQAAKESPHKHVRAAALFHLADQLKYRADYKEAWEKSGGQLDQNTAIMFRRLRDYDAKAARERAERLAKQVRSEYPDAVMPLRHVLPGQECFPIRFTPRPGTGGLRKPQTYAERAEGLLFDLTQLVEGRPAPSLVGRDVEGKEFRLSDCKGKVTIVMFSANWCLPCKEVYPTLRKVQKQFEGKPVEIVSIMADSEVTTVRKAIQNGEITWRAVWDGLQGPIVSKWNVSSFPTLFVFDSQGVIRHKNVLEGEALRQHISELLKERK